jgi:hypothetical protein
VRAFRSGNLNEALREERRNDFQHHYIPVQLAKKRGLYSETGVTMLEEGGLRATTMHQRLYDLDLQQAQLARAHGRYRKMEQARFVSMACENEPKFAFDGYQDFAVSYCSVAGFARLAST